MMLVGLWVQMVFEEMLDDTLKIEIIEDSAAFDRIVLPFVENMKAAGIDAEYDRIDLPVYR